MTASSDISSANIIGGGKKTALPPGEIDSIKAWPFEQARALLKRAEKAGKSEILFETGYGPSGLPHMGTFGEVIRTAMVRRAFEDLAAGRWQTRLICVSDDMDGLRSIPDTVPDPELLRPHLQKPLCRVPDPFGTHQSYGAHMNARLRAFLDRFGFDYEFVSSAELYTSGRYDKTLRRALSRYDDIMSLMLPTLRPERRATYSPFLPISPSTGRVLYEPLTGHDAEAGTVRFIDCDGTEKELPVTGGAVKLQWKPDFGMRWATLGVDFEMFGKDHRANAGIYARVCRLLGGTPPQQFIYEMFLDGRGEKISKSRGNGVGVEEWLHYAPAESLAYYQYVKPRTAKRLHLGVIPGAVDDYLAHRRRYREETPARKRENPVWHVHGGDPDPEDPPLSYALLLNLCTAARISDPDGLWSRLRRFTPDLDRDRAPLTRTLIDSVVNYHRDVIAPAYAPRQPTGRERAALLDLADRLQSAPASADDEALQTIVYDVGKTHGFEPLRDWFKALYEILFGAPSGPRMGGFLAVYGVENGIGLIRERAGPEQG